LAPLRLADSMFLGLPRAEADRCVTHSISAMLREVHCYLVITTCFSVSAMLREPCVRCSTC
jgi:hypothetical protein